MSPDRSGAGTPARGPAPPSDLPVPPLAGAAVKACCAELWAHPAVRLLAGDALRPGGTDLTGDLLDRMSLPHGSRVLDVGCGPGSSLTAVAARGHLPFGVDYSPRLAGEAAHAAAVVAGDAEALPWRDGAFGGVLIECVLSALPDKPAALTQVARVLGDGGALGVSDMTQAGDLPQPLGAVAGWVACTAGALDRDGYRRLLERHGFAVEHVADHTPALAAMIRKARRRLALLRGAAATGILSGADDLLDGLLPSGGLPAPPRDADPGADRGGVASLVDRADALLEQAGQAAADGALGYVAVMARRAGRPSAT